MGRTVIPLNDTKIKSAKAKKKNYTLSDGQGLQLLIKTDGTKIWEFYYQSPTTYKRRKTSFNKYPFVSLQTARNKRSVYLTFIYDGIDPIDYFKEEKEKIKIKEQVKNHTVGNILNDFYKREKTIKSLKADSIKRDKQRVINHFVNHLPRKENENIHDITFNQTKTILFKLEESDKLETLMRVKNILVRMLEYACTENITSGELFAKLKIQKFKIRLKNQVRNNPTFTQKEDIKRIYNDILNYENSFITKYLLILTIHTAQRQGSIIRAKWCDIDLEKKIWIIPKDNMKKISSKVNSKDHHLPISDVMIKYLKNLNKLTSDFEYLFPNSQINKSRNKYPHISNNTVTKALRLMGYSKDEQTAHGFRAMFKTVCKEDQEEHNLNNEFVERVLGHTIGNDVENAYNRARNIKDMRKIVNWWSDYLESLIRKV